MATRIRVRLLSPFGCLALLTLALLSACGGGGSSSPPPPDGGNPPPVVSGLDARPNNTTCLAPIAQSQSIALQSVFTHLPNHSALVGLHQAPNDDAWFYAVHQSGQVYRFANDANVSQKTVFLDVSGRVRHSGESGLLGLAFHPNYAQNRFIFVSYTGGTPLTSYIERYTANPDFASVDMNSRTVILSLAQPYSNHNGGQIAFGPDRYLYIGFGDGGSGGDPHNHGQNTETLLGSLLRIDVDAAQSPYGVPSDNPLIGRAGRDEIFAYGLRNPWRFSFDRHSAELWIADVGQNAWEEINIVSKGDNLGWNVMEGSHCYNSSNCSTNGLKMPVYEYSHSEGCSVTGGYVYRGAAIASLQGQYVFADFCSATVWRLALQTNQTHPNWQRFDIAPAGGAPSSFAEDNQGELYTLLHSGGIKKIVPGAGANEVQVPDNLSQTGCVQAGDPSKPAIGLIPYDINVPFWSDGASKERYLALPNQSTVKTLANGDVEYPAGTVLMKHFRLANQLVETRLLMYHGAFWRGYSYRWNSAQTEATKVLVSTTATVNNQSWLFPSSAQCNQCHTDVAVNVLGPELSQLNRDFLYLSTQRTANQLDTWQHVALFNPALTTAERQRRMPASNDNSASIEQRARAYLHSNCAHCHQPSGPTSVNLDLRFERTLAQTNTCNVSPSAGDLGVSNARRIAPGEASRSVLVLRMERLDHVRMPPLSSFVVDAEGVNLIKSWINSLASC